MSNLSQLINHDDDYSYSYPGVKQETSDGDSLRKSARNDEPAVAESTEAQVKSEEEPSIHNGTEDPDHDDGPSTGGVSHRKILNSFERIKTHFPAARIKKIMQSDDEIGKVAQATPIIVGRALEIFMANLVEASIIEAKKQGVKRIGASHIRAAVENTEQFDFLVEVVDKYPPVKN